MTGTDFVTELVDEEDGFEQAACSVVMSVPSETFKETLKSHKRGSIEEFAHGDMTLGSLETR